MISRNWIRSTRTSPLGYVRYEYALHTLDITVSGTWSGQILTAGLLNVPLGAISEL